MNELIIWINEKLDKLPAEWGLFNESLITDTFEIRLRLIDDSFQFLFVDKRLPALIPLEYVVYDPSQDIVQAFSNTDELATRYVEFEKVKCEYKNEPIHIFVRSGEYKYKEPERLVATGYIDTFFSTAVSEYTKVGGGERIGFNYYKTKREIGTMKYTFIDLINKKVHLNNIFINSSGWRP